LFTGDLLPPREPGGYFVRLHCQDPRLNDAVQSRQTRSCRLGRALAAVSRPLADRVFRRRLRGLCRSRQAL